MQFLYSTTKLGVEGRLVNGVPTKYNSIWCGRGLVPEISHHQVNLGVWPLWERALNGAVGSSGRLTTFVKKVINVQHVIKEKGLTPGYDLQSEGRIARFEGGGRLTDSTLGKVVLGKSLGGERGTEEVKLLSIDAWMISCEAVYMSDLARRLEVKSTTNCLLFPVCQSYTSRGDLL